MIKQLKTKKMKKKNLLFTAIAIFGLAATTIAQVPSYVPTNGLVGWWPFTGNAIDSSGNGNNGTVNGAIPDNDRYGSTNHSYLFNGINNYIRVSNNPNLVLDSNFTISCWVKILGLNTFNTFLSNASNNQTGVSGWVWGYANFSSPAKIHFQAYPFYNNSTLSQIGGNLTNTWHNISVTYDKGDSKLKYFVNGQMTDTFTIAYNITNANLDFFIGNHFQNNNPSTPVPTNGSFNGNIDDIGIWNRALTQQEITDLYNGCQLAVNTQPTNQTININNNAQFVVSSSDPGATYQWQTDFGVGFQNLNNVGQYSGTANDTLDIANVTLSNNSQPFRCIISSGSCTDTSNVAVLTVNNNTGINEVSQSNLFSVYPNPANSQINVKANAKLLGSIYTVYDNTGKLVLTGKINSENTVIELGNLSGGIYLFSVGENLKQTFKVIKE